MALWDFCVCAVGDDTGRHVLVDFEEDQDGDDNPALIRQKRKFMDEWIQARIEFHYNHWQEFMRMLVDSYVRMARRRGNKLLPGDLELRIDQSLKRDFAVKWVCPHPECADKPSYETSREALEPHFTQVHRALLQARRIIVKKDMHGQRSLATPAHAAAPGDLLPAVDDGAGARAGAGAGGRARDGGGAASGSGAGEKPKSGKRARSAEGKEGKRARKEAETLEDAMTYSKSQGDLEPGKCARYGDKCVGAQTPHKPWL